MLYKALSNQCKCSTTLDCLSYYGVNYVYIRVVHFDIILSKVEGRKLTYFLKSRISKVEVFRYFKKAESRRSKVFDIMKSSKIEVEVFWYSKKFAKRKAKVNDIYSDIKKEDNLYNIIF